MRGLDNGSERSGQQKGRDGGQGLDPLNKFEGLGPGLVRALSVHVMHWEPGWPGRCRQK